MSADDHAESRQAGSDVNVGSRVGPYEIVAEIGAGGMGVVYRARDTRLGRDVAIKVSSERFTERFEREARAVASLNHPNICTLHDVGPDYLVMELVEGETLADLLAQRPRSSPGLPFEDTVRLARQIASALEAAHEKGVIHRDLKPGNIKITPDGTVKVLDFGLAKFDVAHADAASGSDAHQLTNSPTLDATGVGLILGTAAYMAPEQARGKRVDKRADIWAFGVVLYEMLTGSKPFVGEDVSTILAAVIQAEPRWDGVPRSLQRLLKKCLEKDPRRRLRDIGDMWHVVDDEPVAANSSASGYLGWLAAAVLAVVAAVALWAPWRRSTPPVDRPLVRFDVDLGSEVALPTLDRPTPSTLAISPDGTRLVYVASVAGAPLKLFTRRLDQSNASELVGTVGAGNPFFSPDGQWVGFHDGTRLFKISVEGGAATPLMEVVIFAGAMWTNDGDLIVGSGLKQGLLRLPAGGGAPTSLIELAPGELFYTMPQLLPGGDLLVTIYNSPPGLERAAIDVVSLRDRSRKTIARGGTGARYLPSGHLIYTNASTMFAVPFDLNARETRGTAVPVLNDIAYDPSANLPQYDISADGTLVYRATASRGPNTARITWLDATGKREALPGPPAEYPSLPRLSPDGKRLAATVREGTNQDIWIYDTERDQRTRLTFGTETFASPVWSRDGKYVVFGSIGNGLFWARADGGGQPQSLVKRASIVFPFSFSPDGRRLAFYEVSRTPQIMTVAVDDGDGLKAGEPEAYMSNPFAETAPKFSPDGHWLAYESNETGRTEIYVRAFPAAAQGGKWPISNGGGSLPVWSPNGRELLFQSGDQIMSVDYKATGNVFSAGKPRVWLTSMGGAQGFDVASDGKRLIAYIPTASGNASKTEHTLVFVQNFFDELRRRVPIAP
jgi:serine/threonine protein kinase/Tol biopolymer transport system component